MGQQWVDAEERRFPRTDTCKDCGAEIVWAAVFPSANRHAKLPIDAANVIEGSIYKTGIYIKDDGGVTITPTYKLGKHKCPEPDPDSYLLFGGQDPDDLDGVIDLGDWA